MKKERVVWLFIFVLLGSILFLYFFQKKPMVSVVLPTYNRGDVFLKRALNSILAQTYRDFEVIVIDDGSTDQTPEILDFYQKIDPRIRVIRHETNQGLIAGLNEGLDFARGKYIARMDDDDISLPDRFEKQVDFLEKHPEITVLGSFISPIGSMKPYPFQQQTDPDLFKINLFLGIQDISHPSAMIRRDFLKKHKIRYRKQFATAEDRPFWAEIMDAGGEIRVYPEVLLQYRLHQENEKSYYIQQRDAVLDFHQRYFQRFCSEGFCFPETRCGRIQQMIRVNPKVSEVSQEKLEKLYQKECSENSYLKTLDDDLEIFHLRHENWSDDLWVKKNRGILYVTEEKATILLKQDGLLILKWDRTGEKQKLYLENGSYLFKEN